MTVAHNLKFVCLFIVITLVSGALNPIVLIPGDGGSQVEARLNKSTTVHYICEKTADYFNIWLNMELLLPVVIDCWIDNIKLVYDNVTRTTRNVDGVDTRIPGFGSTETVEWLDPSHASSGAYFNSIAAKLVTLGHERNVSIKGAPYDFRKAPNENQEWFSNVKTLIEQTYADNSNEPIIIIAHSMGGLMAAEFLTRQTQDWKDRYIRCLVTLSGAWGGSVKALKVYAIGDNLGSYVLRESVMREEQISNPSLSWLLPSRLFWKPDEVLIETDRKNFTLSNLQSFFNAIDFPDGWEMRKDTEPYQLNFQAPGVEVHCLYGSSVPTVEKLQYKPGTWLDGYPTLVTGDGDGTVNRRSLEGCLHWNHQQKQNIYAKEIQNVDHMQILRDKYVLEYISGLVNLI